MRALCTRAPEPVFHVCMTPLPPPHPGPHTEWHLPPRPGLGRLEWTRFRALFDVAISVRTRSLSRALATMAQARDARAIHAVAHSLEFWPALLAARALGVPYFLTAHDHLRYTLRGNPARATALKRLGEAWRSATHRFVVSEALAHEYKENYGQRPFTVVTDGIEGDPRPYQPPTAGLVKAYFAGAFHLAYGDNLRAFLGGLERLGGCASRPSVSFTGRCGSLDDHDLPGTVPITVLPFADEHAVHADLEQADLLYLPLPFGERYADFGRFSLSTKAITYLGSGRPIVYHGPRDSVIGALLAEHDAAIVIPSLDPQEIADALEAGLARGAALTANAGGLARRQFRLEDQRERFWSAIQASLAS